MARGKQAAKAAKHRVEARDEIIDRLTTELTEAKLRARLSEEASRKALAENARFHDLREMIESDELLQKVMMAYEHQSLLAREYRIWIDSLRDALFDLSRRYSKFLGMATIDMTEWLTERYPEIFLNEDLGKGLATSGVVHSENLSSEQIARIQVVRGKRSLSPSGEVIQWSAATAAAWELVQRQIVNKLENDPESPWWKG